MYIGTMSCIYTYMALCENPYVNKGKFQPLRRHPCASQLDAKDCESCSEGQEVAAGASKLHNDRMAMRRACAEPSHKASSQQLQSPAGNEMALGLQIDAFLDHSYFSALRWGPSPYKYICIYIYIYAQNLNYLFPLRQGLRYIYVYIQIWLRTRMTKYGILRKFV